jgi:hypothetical protein
MKIVKKASGRKTIKISKSEWEKIGKQAGWNEEDDSKELHVGKTYIATKNLIFDGNTWYPENKSVSKNENEDIQQGDILKIVGYHHNTNSVMVKPSRGENFDISLDNFTDLLDENLLSEK